MSNILDGLSGGVQLFLFCLVLLVAYYIFHSIEGSGLFGIYAADFEKFYTSLNNMSIYIFLAMSLGAVFSALLIRAHPAFFFISVILVILEFLVIPPLVNAYNGVAAQFPTESSDLAQNVALMQMLPLWTAVATLLAAVIAIGKEA